MFSMLPSIGRARCRWLNIVVDHLVDVDLCPHLFIDHHRVIFFSACSIFVVGLDHEIILTAKFSPSI